MTLKTTLIALLTPVAVCFVTTPAMSEPYYDLNVESKISIQDHSQDQVKAACDGYYGLPNSQGTYYCVNKDGSGIMCGGIANNKDTCDTFHVTPTNAAGSTGLLEEILATPLATSPDQVPDFPERAICRVVHCDHGWCSSC